MPGIIIAESGSTKTDWCHAGSGFKPVHYKTSGINPYLQSPEGIAEMLDKELAWGSKGEPVDEVFFYGAGATGKEGVASLKKLLVKIFGTKKVTVQCDMMGAARSLCARDKGMVCILGTGSNSCYYDGKKIAASQTSLGYIAGDEGSGNHMGKRILQYYAYNTFDAELRGQFEALFGSDMDAIISKLYSTLFPNRYLATFVKLLTTMRGHYMVENIIEDCLYEFFHCQILKYRQSWKEPIHFTGSIAHEFRDVLQSLCSQYELEMGRIVQSPMDGLVKYHTSQGRDAIAT